MIIFNFQVDNPWCKNKFKNIWHRAGDISKNQAWELELYYSDCTVFKVNLTIKFTGSDHAGPSVEFCLFGYTFSAMIYDTRHWDYEKNQWETHE